ncbi:MAG: Predicted amidohydrolase RutB in novel pyrimidine catabolism pathway [uncultured Craurococcus sp.]|uniref:Predicted amidohydrolase RutB in novel pyrimidine catabolism pathway n=1 Tax=uncultured Craurococcus sp. TaxID=1135998 RepID=A0A6J4HXL6_9PROT|nr:MAG: Predicted amidohydrolase RutB in novel pyrimidine catabolism pathway [uncultured Craurococcus sp.]
MPRAVQLSARPEPITVVPEETALIVVDMQNAYLSPGGYIDLVGFDVSGAPPVIEETAQVIAACRAAGIPVIYLQNGFSPDQREVGGPSAPVWHKSNALKFMRANEAYAGRLITHGTWDHAIVEALAPEPGDILVPKSRYSGFAGTGLEQILAARRIRTLLVAGVATNVCVESTIRDAYHREFFPVMVTDATMAAGPAAQQATEFNIETFFGWLTTGAEVRAALLNNQ